jgi:transcription termination/antitermination protein NusG
MFMNVETATTGTPMHMPSIAVAGRSWFAVHTRPRYERKVHSELQEKGVQTFLPLHSEIHQWSDRKRTVEVPLFPGYIFVRVTSVADDRVRVLRANGVINFVGARNIGVVIPDSEIDSVQSVVKSGLPFKPYPHLEIGQRVYVRGGCLDGVQGVLTAVNGDRGLVVSVKLIQRSIAMRIEGFKVEAA